MILVHYGLLLAFAKPKVETLIFVTTDCPISKRYVPALKRVMKEYKDVSTFRFVYVDSGLSYDKAKAHHDDYNIKSQLIVDSKREIAKKYEIKAVPTVVVKDKSDAVLYRGRVDDSYGADYKWHTPKQHDLRNALAAIKSGQPVPIRFTPVIGCTLSE
jgi:thiol-disulfide isomerase/thioredoxin